MKILRNTSQQMDDLFHEARQEKPVMNLKEVENIVRTGHYVPASGVRRSGNGINTVIVIGGIVICSFLAYMVLKVDTKDVAKNPVMVNPIVSEQTSITPPINTEKQVTTEPKQIAVSAVKKSDKVRPQTKPDQFVASTDNAVIATNNESAETVDNNEVVAPAPSYTKTISSEFTIGFTTYDNQDVKMKLREDDVTSLVIDGRVIPEEEFSNYSKVISEGKNFNSLHLMNYFDAQLRSDNILGTNSQYVFELSSSKLLINKTPQSDEVFSKYKKLYETKTGKVVTEGSVYSYKFEK